MAIDQIKTINELERLPQVEDSNAFAASTGGATGSVTANQIMEYMKQYLESLSNKSTTLTESDSQYPTCNAVSKETTRIINIMNNAISIASNNSIYLKVFGKSNKLLIQWGKITASQMTFPVAFTAPPVIVAGGEYSYGSDRLITSSSATGFTCRFSNTYFSYLAIGY